MCGVDSFGSFWNPELRGVVRRIIEKIFTNNDIQLLNVLSVPIRF